MPTKNVVVTLVCTRTRDNYGTARPDDPRVVDGYWVEYRVKSVKNSTTPTVGEDITKDRVDALIALGIEVNIVRS